MENESIPTGIGVFLVLLFFAFITVPIDYMLAALYHSLRGELVRQERAGGENIPGTPIMMPWGGKRVSILHL